MPPGRGSTLMNATSREHQAGVSDRDESERSVRGRISVLGDVEFHVGDRPVPLGRGLRKLLVSRLALAAPDSVSLEALLADLWHDGVELDDPRRSLHNTVWRLRQTLEGVRTGASSLIEHVGRGYGLSGACDVDAAEFRQLVQPGGVLADPELDRLGAALDLWRGPALSGLADAPFVGPSIAELDELRWAAFERRCGLMTDAARDEELIVDLRAATRLNPLRESLWALLMAALHRCGRTAEALRVYGELREVLANQLGIGPSSRLERLESDILLGRRGDGDRPSARIPGTGRRPPHPTSALIGREADMEALTALMSTHRIVTIAGPPGCGKTRLANEYAALSDDAWWVDLASLEANADVAATVASAVGIAVAADSVLAVASSFHDRPGLIVLDNAEHVVVDVERVCSGLLAATPNVRLLATSRVMLEVPGGAVWSLEPLDVPAAGADATRIRGSSSVELFLERAWSASPRWRPHDRDIRTVAEIVRAVDGIPLAIEIAAARVRSLSVDQIADFVPALATVGKSEQPRSALGPALEWSWSLLDEGAAELLDRLSVFAGAFGIDDAVALSEADRDDVIARLDELVRNSLVAVGSPGSTVAKPLRLLATIRAAGEAHLIAQRAWPAVALRHFTFVEDLVLRRPSSAEAIELSAEFLAAIRRSPSLGCIDRAIELVRVAAMNGMWAHERLLPYAVEATQGLLANHDERTPLRVKGLSALLLVLAAAERWPELRAAASECSVLVDELGMVPLASGAAALLALAHWGLGNTQEARTILGGIDPSSTNPMIRVFAHMCRSRIEFDEGRPTEARTSLDAATAEIPPDAPRTGSLAHTTNLVALERAWQAIRSGDPEGRRLIDAALEASMATGWHNATLDCRALQAQLIGDAGDVVLAEQRLLQVLADCRAVGDVRKQVRSIDLLARVAVARNDLAVAAERLTEADDLRVRHEVRLRPADAALVEATRAAVTAAR